MMRESGEGRSVHFFGCGEQRFRDPSALGLELTQDLAPVGVIPRPPNQPVPYQSVDQSSNSWGALRQAPGDFQRGQSIRHIPKYRKYLSLLESDTAPGYGPLLAQPHSFGGSQQCRDSGGSTGRIVGNGHGTSMLVND